MSIMHVWQLAWYRILRSQRDVGKVHPDLGLPTHVRLTYTPNPTFHPGLSHSTPFGSYNLPSKLQLPGWLMQFSVHHSACVMTDEAWNLGAPSRRIMSLSSFSPMFVTMQNWWAESSNVFPWTSLVSLYSHGALSTCVTMSSCTTDFLWAITMETRILHPCGCRRMPLI